MHAAAGWPVGVRRLVSVVLIFHIVAILVGALSSPPSSLLERSLAEKFAPYFQVIDQGYAYRYYAPEPPPTPVVTATIRFADGRPDETVRLPRKETFPWLLRQRQLALANHLYTDSQAAKTEGGDASRSRWGRSYARHLAKTHPGCSSIVLTTQLHLIPDVERVREMLARAGLEGGGSRRRGVLHHARADRRVRAVRRLLNDLAAYLAVLSADSGPGLERLLLHPGRPDRAGPDPRRRSVCCCSGTWRSTASTSTASSARRAGPTPRSSDSSRASARRMPGRSGSSFPTACSGRPGSSAWWSWRCTPLGLFSRVDGGARLGDRGLDRAAVAGDALRVRPDRLDAWRSTWRSRGRAARRSRSTASWPASAWRGR